MIHIRPRFSLKLLLLAFPIVAAATFWLSLPTQRAQRFTRYVSGGNSKDAAAMLPVSLRTRYQGTLEIERLVGIKEWTLGEIFRGRRTVVVGSCWQNGSVEFIFTPTTVEVGESLVCW